MTSRDHAGPASAESFDAVIVGGGAAGLSLVCHLAHAGWRGRLAIVDDGDHPLAHRSWAWWGRGEGLLDAHATARFHHLEAAGPTWRRHAPLAPHTYLSITGSALAEAAQAALARLDDGVRVAGRALGVAQGDDAVVVTVDMPGGGVTRLSAPWVFDSVGPGTSRADPRSAPHLDFLGLHIESDRDVFDADAVTLMDFRTGQGDGVAFVYVLPSSPRTALVERTVFVHPGACGRVRGDHEAELATYLRDTLALPGARVTGREEGLIPLVAHAPARPGGGIVPIGARAGMVRASTGYAFARIQRHGEEIARRLVANRDPRRAAPPERWPRLLDAALLRVIRADPDAVREAFAAMLTAHPPARTLRFLDGEASLVDHARIFASLPLLRFARAQVSDLRPAARRGRRPTVDR